MARVCELEPSGCDAAVQARENLEFEILVRAVNLARFERIQRLKTLRFRLSVEFPGREDAIDAALRTWANYEALSAYRSKMG